MATTPEGKVKEAVKKRLAHFGVLPFHKAAQLDAGTYNGFFWMPVQGQFAVQGVHDFVGVWHGVFFSLETKAPNNKEDETGPQGDFRAVVTACGGIALTGVRDPETVARLAAYIHERTGK